MQTRIETVIELFNELCQQTVPRLADLECIIEYIYSKYHLRRILNKFQQNDDTLSEQMIESIFKELKVFLAVRWNLIQGTDLSYTHSTNYPLTQICISIADLLSSHYKISRYIILMPTLEADLLDVISFTETGEFLKSQTLQCHEFIVSEDYKRPIVVLDCLNSSKIDGKLKHTSLLDGKSENLTDLESKMVVFHSYDTLEYYKTIKKMLNIRENGTSVGSAIQRLINSLQNGGANGNAQGKSERKGEEYNSGADANEGIAEFSKFWQVLTGYDLCLMSDETKPEVNKLYVREVKEELTYTVFTPNGVLMQDIPIPKDKIAIPVSFTLENIRPLFLNILKITTENGHTILDGEKQKISECGESALTVDFGECWGRLARPTSAEYQNEIYCVEMIAGNMQRILDHNKQLFHMFPTNKEAGIKFDLECLEHKSEIAHQRLQSSLTRIGYQVNEGHANSTPRLWNKLVEILDKDWSEVISHIDIRIELSLMTKEISETDVKIAIGCISKDKLPILWDILCCISIRRSRLYGLFFSELGNEEKSLNNFFKFIINNLDTKTPFLTLNNLVDIVNALGYIQALTFFSLISENGIENFISTLSMFGLFLFQIKSNKDLLPRFITEDNIKSMAANEYKNLGSYLDSFTKEDFFSVIDNIVTLSESQSWGKNRFPLEPEKDCPQDEYKSSQQENTNLILEADPLSLPILLTAFPISKRLQYLKLLEPQDIITAESEYSFANILEQLESKDWYPFLEHFMSNLQRDDLPESILSLQTMKLIFAKIEKKDILNFIILLRKVSIELDFIQLILRHINIEQFLDYIKEIITLYKTKTQLIIEHAFDFIYPSLNFITDKKNEISEEKRHIQIDSECHTNFLNYVSALNVKFDFPPCSIIDIYSTMTVEERFKFLEIVNQFNFVHVMLVTIKDDKFDSLKPNLQFDLMIQADKLQLNLHEKMRTCLDNFLNASSNYSYNPVESKEVSFYSYFSCARKLVRCLSHYSYDYRFDFLQKIHIGYWESLYNNDEKSNNLDAAKLILYAYIGDNLFLNTRLSCRDVDKISIPEVIDIIKLNPSKPIKYRLYLQSLLTVYIDQLQKEDKEYSLQHNKLFSTNLKQIIQAAILFKKVLDNKEPSSSLEQYLSEFKKGDIGLIYDRYRKLEQANVTKCLSKK